MVLTTEWKEFRSPDFNVIKDSLTFPVIIDGRNLYNPQRLKKQGFIYYAVGRGESMSKVPTKIVSRKVSA